MAATRDPQLRVDTGHLTALVQAPAARVPVDACRRPFLCFDPTHLVRWDPSLSRSLTVPRLVQVNSEIRPARLLMLCLRGAAVKDYGTRRQRRICNGFIDVGEESDIISTASRVGLNAPANLPTPLKAVTPVRIR